MYCGTYARTCANADEADMEEALWRGTQPPPTTIHRSLPAPNGVIEVSAVYPDCPRGITHLPVSDVMPTPAPTGTVPTGSAPPTARPAAPAPVVSPAPSPAPSRSLAAIAPGLVPDFRAGALALVGADVTDALAALNNPEPEMLWALIKKETPFLAGFMPDRRPVILYERHVFSRLTRHQYDALHPDISGSRYGAGEYGTYAHQYERLAEAMQLDEAAAMQSASWGMGQTLGEVYAEIGYDAVERMVQDMIASERTQLRAAVKEIRSKGIVGAFKNRDFDAFAAKYNGPAYGDYATVLQQHYAAYKASGLPDLDVRRAQLYLGYLGYAPGPVDGVRGTKVGLAARAFQAKLGLPPTGDLDAATLARIDRAAFP